MNAKTLTVKEFHDHFRERLHLEWIAGKQGGERLIADPSINRPSLALAAYFKHFAAARVQLFGNGEMGFILDLDEKRRREVILELIQRNVPCIVVANQYAPCEILKAVAEETQTPLFVSAITSREFMAQATHALEDAFAPHEWIHGTLIDVRGLGVLLMGDSGVGKSECALALIDRGHALVADDITDIKCIGSHIIGQSPPAGRAHMECRGIGIIDVIKLFGARAYQPQKPIHMVVRLHTWKSGDPDDRTGMERRTHTLMGIEIPCVDLYVRPGRDVARMVEVAALIQALRRMGYDGAQLYNADLMNTLNTEV